VIILLVHAMTLLRHLILLCIFALAQKLNQPHLALQEHMELHQLVSAMTLPRLSIMSQKFALLLHHLHPQLARSILLVIILLVLAMTLLRHSILQCIFALAQPLNQPQKLALQEPLDFHRLVIAMILPRLSIM
jgi:hypothetical protein